MTGVLVASDIGAQYVARRRTDVVSEELDGETVIWDGRDGNLHILNATATIVWGCLDGEVAVDQLARELSEAFRVDAAQMLADVLDAVRSFGEQGLLEGVAPGDHDGADPAGVEATPDEQEPNHEPRFLPPPPAG